MESATNVLIGSSGDLAKRKIIPALYNLFLEQKIPRSFPMLRWISSTFPIFPIRPNQ